MPLGTGGGPYPASFVVGEKLEAAGAALLFVRVVLGGALHSQLVTYELTLVVYQLSWNHLYFFTFFLVLSWAVTPQI